MSTSHVAVITGTSTGFGYDTARLLAAAGNKVFGTMRDVKGRNAEPARL
ncbi:MAG: SDR family NAD(P)-dependent oxidoreductase, partial [Candidatus Eremiobacteraeota bacterium]|nr:SDR family NAD(P)-dependent oxidoreductase [Candidatus Eremiobacteraeota bacterium]